MKAIVYTGSQTLTLQDIPQPEAKPGYALVKSAYTGICGGDLNILAGTHPRAKAPLVMGHEFTGTVAGGDTDLPVGTKVFANPIISCGTCRPCRTGDSHVCETLRLVGIDTDGAMAEYVLVANDQLWPLPAGVDLKEGALAEPIAVVVHAIRETGYRAGDRCLIFGCGPIGLCLALTLRAFGASEIVIVEPNDFKRAAAAKLGFVTLNPKEADVVTEVANRTNGSGYDVVYDCAGHQSVLDILPEVVRVRGNIVIVAGYKKPAAFAWFRGMVKEFSIHFCRVYRDKDIEIAMQLLAANPDFNAAITHVLSKEEPQKGFDLMADPNAEAMKILYSFAD